MSNPAITLVPPRRYYDTATVAETHRRLLAERAQHFGECTARSGRL